jgi:hypothetical protein
MAKGKRTKDKKGSSKNAHQSKDRVTRTTQKKPVGFIYSLRYMPFFVVRWQLGTL